MQGLGLNTQEHLALIHALPCVVCLNNYGRNVNATEAHHIETYRHKNSEYATVPLCHDCHSLLHQMRRKPFYDLHHLDDVKIMALTVKLIVNYLEAKWTLPRN